MTKIEITIDGKTKQSIISQFAGRIAIEGGYFTHVKYVGIAATDLMYDVKKTIGSYLINTYGSNDVIIKNLY